MLFSIQFCLICNRNLSNPIIRNSNLFGVQDKLMQLSYSQLKLVYCAREIYATLSYSQLKLVYCAREIYATQ